VTRSGLYSTLGVEISASVVCDARVCVCGVNTKIQYKNKKKLFITLEC
jgi:hypothetical protein